jgi:hypothetical protein
MTTAMLLILGYKNYKFVLIYRLFTLISTASGKRTAGLNGKETLKLKFHKS